MLNDESLGPIQFKKNLTENINKWKYLLLEFEIKLFCKIASVNRIRENKV